MSLFNRAENPNQVNYVGDFGEEGKEGAGKRGGGLSSNWEV